MWVSMSGFLDGFLEEKKLKRPFVLSEFFPLVFFNKHEVSQSFIKVIFL